MIDRVQQRQIRLVLVTALIVGGICLAVSPLIDEHFSFRTLGAGFFMGFMSVLAIFSIEAWLKGRLSLKTPLIVTLSVSIVLDILALAAIQVAATILFSLSMDNSDLMDMFERTDFQVGLLAIGLLVLVTQFILMIGTVLGHGVLPRLLLGTYRTPRDVERFFMFLDLRDSTRIAEKLGQQRFLAFLNEFYRDLDQAAIHTRAEIHKYAGDGAVLTWKLRSKPENTQAVEFFFRLQTILDGRKGRYQKLFGEVPRFKAGLHFGQAVIAEMGHSKKEIALIGDAMNTTARLEQACKEFGENFLVSRVALDRMSVPAGCQIHQVYREQLRGKEDIIEFCGLEF